jgi:glycosyltransferase involved in cell wall biosynthesis
MKRSNAHRRPRLCITSPWNYPLFDPASNSHFGGWEVRIGLIARELARRKNFQVSLIVGDHGQPHVVHKEGIDLYSWVGREIWGIPFPELQKRPALARTPRVGRFLGTIQTFLSPPKGIAPKSDPLRGQVGSYAITPEMLAIYDEVESEIHMVPGNSQFSGEAAYYCVHRGKRFVFLSGSDYDYYPEYKMHPGRCDMYSVPFALKAYAIANASLHIVQNEHQAHLLEQGYGRASRLVRNPVDLAPQFPRNPSPQTILWVGKSDERTKRPSMVFEIARRMPQHRFVVIMTFALKETHERCIDDAGRLPNVTLVERVPYCEIERYFAAARLNLNTSLVEGFPNTILQAAKYEVPTVSLQIDPDGILSRHGCGVVCRGDLEEMIEKVGTLMADSELCARLGRQAQEYVQRVHDKDRIVPQYEEALMSVLDNH